MAEKKNYNKSHDAWVKDNIDRVVVKLHKGEKAVWQERAKAEGKSLNKYIIDKVETRE